MSKAQLCKKYGITIVENGYYNLHGKYVKLYDIYSADGCCWEKGMKSVKAIQEECEYWSENLLRIKKICKNF